MSQKKLDIPEAHVRPSPEEVAVAETRTFQRLFHMKQLGLAYVVYPSATQTRGIRGIQCLH